MFPFKSCNLFKLCKVRLISNFTANRHCHRFRLGTSIYNTDYLLNKSNTDEIENNIKIRKGIGDIKLVYELNDRLKNNNLTNEQKNEISENLQLELKKIPNQTHPAVRNYGEDPKVLRYVNEKQNFAHKPLDFGVISKALNITRTEQLGNFNGHKSYYLINELAELEQALIRYATSKVLAKGFELMSVPDILPAKVIQSCGMNTHGERNQVFKLKSDKPKNDSLCLSGTSEMALAGYFAGSTTDFKKLPLKMVAVSRCFRAETSAMQEERGIYRVHQFTKVEMFSVCHPSDSESILNEFRDIEESLFTDLGLHFQVLDMPPCELGAPAYRKYDIEAWMPGRKMWGEISSCSNCTDYQSRRLNIKFRDDQNVGFAHTVNGTACAIPRMLIAIVEHYQNSNGSITIPKVLRKYMRGKEKIVKTKRVPELKLVKKIEQKEFA